MIRQTISIKKVADDFLLVSHQVFQAGKCQGRHDIGRTDATQIHRIALAEKMILIVQNDQAKNS
jgi:hypothetical protein